MHINAGYLQSQARIPFIWYVKYEWIGAAGHQAPLNKIKSNPGLGWGCYGWVGNDTVIS